MTAQLPGEALAQRIESGVPGAVEEWGEAEVRVKPQALLEVCRLLKETPDLGMDYLVSVTGVDYIDHFEVVYHLASLAHNHATVLKTRAQARWPPHTTPCTPLLLEVGR